MSPRRPIVWAIAGSDSSGGAGLQSDIKTLSALAVHGATVVTAVTAQSLTACNEIFSLSRAQLAAQIKALHDELAPRVIKTGMLASRAASEILESYLKEHDTALICDPVLKSSS